MKSVKLEWCLGDIKKANELLVESVKHYPNFAKVSCLHCCLLAWLMLTLIHCSVL